MLSFTVNSIAQDYKSTYHLHKLANYVLYAVLEPTGLLDNSTKNYVNLIGCFIVVGPHGDSIRTSRKISIDTYRGMSKHGGRAFSGKDPSKVDRSAVYLAIYVAKNIVAADLYDLCEVVLAYATAAPFPVSVTIDTFGTAKMDEGIKI